MRTVYPIQLPRIEKYESLRIAKTFISFTYFIAVMHFNRANSRAYDSF